MERMEFLIYGIILLGSFLLYLFIIAWIDKAKESPVKWRVLSYGEMLKDSRWREKREKILNRDGYKCRWCGSGENLQVHHKYYSRYPNGVKVEPWNYPDDALITLCDKCHKKVHDKKKMKIYYRRYNDNY